MHQKLLANTIGQSLSDHLIAVAFLSKQIVDRLELDANTKGSLSNQAFLSGLFHDIGKLDPEFQKYITKSKEDLLLKEVDFDGYHNENLLETRANHQEFSWAILNSFDVSIFGQKLKDKNLQLVSYATYWHHKKLKRTKDTENTFEEIKNILKSLSQEDFTKLCESLEILVSQLNETYKTLTNEELQLSIVPKEYEGIDYLPDIKTPAFKNFNAQEKTYDYQKNARHTLLRSCLIAADRSISEMNDDSELSIILKNKRHNQLSDRIFVHKNREMVSDLHGEILKGINDPKFNDKERCLKQSETASELASKTYSILSGPPGCGKTRIALEWASKKNPNKILWICPRVNICHSIFNELANEYLPNSKIELLTGELKQIKNGNKKIEENHPDNAFSGDIVVTTIDAILSRLTSNNRAKDLPGVLDSIFIFDEFHEFYNLPSMIFLFKELLYLLNLSSNRFLLMSATPNPYFIKKLDLEDFNEDYHIVKAWDFNQSQYHIDIPKYEDSDSHPSNIVEDNCIFIYNNIEKAQLDYLLNLDKEKSICFHSSFVKEDKVAVYNELMSNFGKNKKNNYTSLRAGPIVQASLNISQDKMYTDICSPENLLQRFGRCNRFGKDIIANFKVLVPTSKKSSSITAYLNKVEYSLNTSFKFIEYLEDKISSQGLINRQDLSDLYFQFHKEQVSLYEKDFESILNDAFSFLKSTSGLEPVKYLNIKFKDRVALVLSGGFRGSSVYILPTTTHIIKEANGINFIPDNKYLYDPKKFDEKTDDLLTADPDSMSMEPLIQEYSANLKHLDKKMNKYNSKVEILKYKAKNVEFPILCNYTKEDYEKIGKNDFNTISNNEQYLTYVHFCKNNREFSVGLISNKIITKYNALKKEKK